MTEKASDSRYDYEIPTEEETPRQNVVKASDAKYDYELPADAAAGDEAPKSEYLGKPPGYEPKTTAAPYPAGFPIFGGADPNDARPIKRADQIRAERAAAHPDQFAALRAKTAPPAPELPPEAQPVMRADQIREDRRRRKLGTNPELERLAAGRYDAPRPEAALGGALTPARGAEALRGPVGAVAGAFKAAGEAYEAGMQQASAAVDADQTGIAAAPVAAANLFKKGADILGKQVERQNEAARTVARQFADGVAPGSTDLQGAAEGLADVAGMAADPRVTYGFAAGHGLAKATLGAAAPLVDKAVMAAFGAAGAKDVVEGLTDRYIAKNIEGDEDKAREATRKAVFGASLVAPVLGVPALETFANRANESIHARDVARATNERASRAPEAARRAGLLADLGLPESASDEQITGAIKRTLKETHPDIPGNAWDALGQQRFNRAIEARDQMPAAGEPSIEPVPVPGKSVPQRAIETGRALMDAVQLGDWEGARAALRILRDPMAEEAPILGQVSGREPLPQRPVPPGRRLGAANDREDAAGIPSEVGVGQEPVEAEPVAGASGEAPRDGGVVQGPQAREEVPSGPVPQVGPGQEKVQGEAPLDMRAQEQALLAGARQAILFHKAGPGPDSAFPPFGIERVMTPAGEIWFRTDTGLTMDRVKEMAQSVEGLGKLLEMPAGRPKGENPKAVSVIDQDGNEVWSAEIDDKTRQATLKRATAMAEKIGGVVTETTRKQVVAGRQQRAKEQTNVPLPPKPEELQGIRPYEQGETVLYIPLGGKEKEGVIGSVLDNGKFRVVDRQGMASIVGPEKMRRPGQPEAAPQAAPAPEPEPPAPAPAKKPKKAKAAPAVDMNRQAVANHLKVTVGSGWEEELVGLDRAAQDFEAKEGRSKAEFWKELANDTIGAAPAPEPIHKPVEAPKVETGDLGKVVTGPDDVAITAEGEEIPYTWAFVNVHKLIPSHDSAGNPNPGYARAGETIQNRDRASEDSVAQMSSIKSNPDPRRLAYAPSATDGAPIIRPDGRALTNGRTAGLQAAFKEGNAAKYRAGIAAEARRTGMSEEAIAEGMKDPESVLVRLAKAEYINKTDQTRLARDTNVGVGLRMSITEQGRSDAAVMMSPGSVDETTRVLALIPEDGNGDIRSSAYLPFAQAFAKAFVPANERAGLFDKGSLTNEGALRVQAALVAAAYGDSKVVDRFLTSDAGAGNPLRKAVIAVAPDFAAVNMQQQHGELEAFDVTPPLVDAAEFIVDMQASGKTLEQTLRPTGKTGSGKKLQAPELIKATDRLSPEGLDIINILDQYARTPAKASKLLIGIFRELAKVAQQLKISRDQGGLFGEGEIEKVPVPKISEAWKIAKENYEEQQRGKGLLEDEDAEPVGAEAEGAGTATLEGAGEGGTAPDKGKTPPPDDQLREADAEYGAPAIAAPTFFSAVERAIDAMPFRSMPAADLAARLTKAPGVKQEELEWVGLVQWLAEVSGRDMTGRVSKDEVKAFLEENRVEVQPITLGVDPRERAAEIAHKNEMDAAENDWRGALANLAHGLRQRGVIDDTFPLESNAPELRPGGYLADKARAAGLGDLLDSYHKTLEHWKAVQEHAPLPSDRKPAKFGRYTLPGGENYREVLLTKIDPATAKLQAREAELSRRLDEIAALPAAEHEAQGEALTQKYDEVLWELRRVQNRLKGMSEKAADLLYQRDKVHRELERIDPAQVPWDRLVARGGETDPYKLRKNDPEYQRLTAEFERLDAELGEENKRTKKYQKEPFSSGHFDTPNVLVHYRAKDRTDAQGKKVYFLEEVQSDWHQLGRTQGYADPGDSGADAGVPDAPFKKTWPLLAFKHALRYAAENGYDSIAWTPGEVQAARYDLSKRINELVWNKTEKVLIAIDTNGNTVLAQNDVTAEKLPDYIGKEATARILQQPNDQSVLKVKGAEHHEIKRLTGANLSIGGEGMKGFYDKILPAEIGKYVKAWGGKVSLGQPERTGESLSNGRRVDEYAGLPLDPVYSGMGAAVENNKILRAVVGEFPVYVMDLLAANGIAPEDLVRDPSVLSDRLPLHAKRSVRLGLAGALSKIGADLRAGLDAAYETRLDSEILPAVKASDIDTDVATGILFPEPLHVGGGDSTASLNVGARGAGAGTEAGRLAVTSRGGEKSAAEIAAFEEWHKGIVAQRRGDVESDKWWQIHITPAMREAALAGQPLFEKGSKYDDPDQRKLFEEGGSDERGTGGVRKGSDLPGAAVRLTPPAEGGAAQRPGLRPLSERLAARKKAQDSARTLLRGLRAQAVRGVEGPAGALKIEASRLADKLESDRFISLLGYAVASPEALGVIGQVAANPQFEVARALFSDPRTMEVLEDIAYSAGLPEEVHTGGTLIQPETLALEARKRPGQKVRSFHNHPNGDPTPSDPDIAYTKKCAQLIGEDYEGHTIIDHDKYAVVHPDGSVTFHALTPEAISLRPDLFKEEDKARGIGRVVSNWNDLAALGNELHNDEKSVTIVFGAGFGNFKTTRVRAVASLPLAIFANPRVAAKILKAKMGELGAAHVVGYHSGNGLSLMQMSALYDAADEIAYDEGGLTDFLIGPDPTNSIAFRGAYSSRGVPPLAKNTARAGYQKDITNAVRLSENQPGYGEEQPADEKSARQRAFDRWFEGSVVTNEDGSPKVVYHGTHSEHDFDAFWTQGYKVDLGAHFGTPGQANDIIGTRDLIKPGAPTYMPGTTKAMQAVRASSLKRIYPVYLSIKNPLRLPDLGGWVRPRSYIVTIPPGAKGVEGELRKLAVETEEKFEAGDVGVIEDFPGQVKQLLEDMGYDGIVYVNENEAFDEEADSYIAFHPWQIKSATGNKGTFDPANKSILHEGDTDYGVPPMREKGIPADAPHVALARNTQALQGDPDYKEAKAGDREAAVRLVNRLVTPEAVARAKAFGKDVTYVFPHAEEAAGRNAIPGLVATKLAVETGGGLDEEIIQANRVHHTGANAKQRFVARPTFEGPVQKGARYVIVDDVTTFGNTLAELANHIQKNGGEVAGTFVLADASRTPTLAPERRRVDALETRLGDALRATLGLDPAALTRPEVDYFLGFKSPESLRTTVATARQERADRLRSKGVSEEDAPYGNKKSALDYASRFAPGAARALKPRGPEDEIRLAATDPAAGVFSAIFASRAPKASKTSQLPSPLDSHDPEVERRLRAAEGLVAPSLLDSVRKALTDLEHSFTRHFVDLDTKESPTIAVTTDILRQLESSPDFAKTVALDTISYIADGLDKPAMRLFTRILALRDLHRSIDEGLYDEDKELPFGYADKAAVTYDLRKYEAMAKNDPAVEKALEKRERFAHELTQKLVDLELLDEKALEDPRYYHRQVMAIFNQKDAAYVGTGSRDVRVHTKGFQKARTGGGDFNMRYQEAEFEWMAQAHSQIAMQEALDRLREANDIKPALERNAKWQNTLAIYGGIENYQRVQALKAEKAEIYTSAGLVLESDEKKRIAAINAELEEIDPLKPFTDRMGWSIHDLGKRAEEGELDHAPDWLQEAVDELRASSEWEEFRGDSESELFFPLLNYLVSAGKGGSKEAAYILKAVADKKKFIKDELGKDFKTWRGLIPDAHPLAPKSRAVVWQPEKGSIFYRAQTLPERALERFLEEIRSDESEAVDKEAVEALLGKAREALVKAGPKQEWVIPEGLAHTLDNWKGGGREKGFESTWVTLQQGWKQWVLLNPVRALRYNLNNESGDVDVVIAAFPGALRGWAQAARDLWKYTVKEDKSDTALVEEIQRATKLGVVSSGQSFQEIPDINEAGAFKGLTSDDPNVVQKTLETYWSGTKKFSTWRENTLRLAVFRYLEKELKAGAKLYGASRRHEVDAIKDTGERAAKIARELVGDYGNISVSGQYIRRHLIPFYSWMEINAPRYVRLLKNAAYEDRSGGGGGRGGDGRGGRGGGGGAAGRVAAVGAKKIAVNYAKLALFAPLLYGAVQAWNHLVFPEEEKLLAGNRKTLHLILGRNSDGSIRSIRLQGALSDALEWFGAGNVVSDVMDIASGKSTWRNKLNDALTSPIDKIVGGWEPFSKTLFELGFGYKSYPSLFKEGTTDLSPKKIRDRAEYAGDVVWPVGALYRKVTGRPRRPSPDMGIPWAGPLLDTLLVARTDPGEAAYWYSRNLAGKFLEAQGKTPSTGGPTGEAKDRADALYYFKRACEWGDDDAAGKWLAEYYELGGTPQKMNEAFVREHPLGGLPLGQRGAFVSSLSEEDRAVVQSAVEWYEKGRERMRETASVTTYVPTQRKMTAP